MRINLKLSIRIVLTSLICFSNQLEVKAGGISTTFSKVYLKNLAIGNTYRTSKLANLPFKTKNNSLNSLGFEMRVIKPSENENLTEGYGPIPDAAWIRLDTYTFKGIEPGEEAITDVIVSIPNSKALKGKKYEAHIVSRTSQGMMRLALKGKLFIEIYEGDQAQVDLSKAEADMANFLIEPEHFEAKELEIGKKYSFKELGGQPFRITNLSKRQVKKKKGFLAMLLNIFGFGKDKEASHKYTVTSIKVPEFLTAEWYEPLDPELIKFGVKSKRNNRKESEYKKYVELMINNGRSKEIDGYIEFDLDKKDLYKGKSYVFAIEVKVGDTKRYLRGFLDLEK